MKQGQKSNRQRFMVTLPVDLHENLKQLAARNRRSMAEELRIAAEERIDAERERDEALKRLGIGAAR